MALPATPADTVTYAQALSEGFWGHRTDALPDAVYTVQGTVSPAPTVTSMTPASGTAAGGTTITLTGTNLTGVTVVGIVDKPCTSVTVVSATSVTAVTPAGKGTRLAVEAANPNGRARLAGAWTYT